MKLIEQCYLFVLLGFMPGFAVVGGGLARLFPGGGSFNHALDVEPGFAGGYWLMPGNSVDAIEGYVQV